MFWGAVKRKVRQRCDYTFAGLEATFREVLLEVAQDSKLLWRLQNHVMRFVDAYKKGAKGTLAAYAVKQYPRHRTLPEAWQSQVEKGFIGKFNTTFQEHLDQELDH